MPGKRFSLAQGMIHRANRGRPGLVASALPADALVIPTIWILLALPNFVLVWKLILRRDCRAFHYTFPIVLLPTFTVLANLTAKESLQILHILVGRFGGIVLDPRRNMQLYEVVHLGEFWLDAAMAIVLAWAAGMLAAWPERRMAWDIAAFWRSPDWPPCRLRRRHDRRWVFQGGPAAPGDPSDRDAIDPPGFLHDRRRGPSACRGSGPGDSARLIRRQPRQRRRGESADRERPDGLRLQVDHPDLVVVGVGDVEARRRRRSGRRAGRTGRVVVVAGLAGRRRRS